MAAQRSHGGLLGCFLTLEVIAERESTKLLAVVPPSARRWQVDVVRRGELEHLPGRSPLAS